MRPSPILLIEDNPDEALFTIAAFTKANIANEVIHARDGDTALGRLLPTDGGSPLQPSIVLLDINMPRMSGLEVLGHLRAASATRLLPVIMLTTSDLDHDIIESYRRGANSYICKSVDFGQYENAIRQLGQYWLELNRSASS
jgi:two-component system response regulator